VTYDADGEVELDLEKVDYVSLMEVRERGGGGEGGGGRGGGVRGFRQPEAPSWR